MQNPFLLLAAGFTGDIGRMMKEGVDKEIMHYDFYDYQFSHGPGMLQISRKDQFANPESGWLAMIPKGYYIEYPEIYTSSYLAGSTEDDFLIDAEEYMLPIYDTRVITEIPVEKFTAVYKAIVRYMTGYYIFENVDLGEWEYVYSHHGIKRNGEDYTGNYFSFDPLLNIVLRDCYSVFDNEPCGKTTRKEYFAISDDYYIRLLWITGEFWDPLF